MFKEAKYYKTFDSLFLSIILIFLDRRRSAMKITIGQTLLQWSVLQWKVCHWPEELERLERFKFKKCCDVQLKHYLLNKVLYLRELFSSFSACWLVATAHSKFTVLTARLSMLGWGWGDYKINWTISYFFLIFTWSGSAVIISARIL